MGPNRGQPNAELLLVDWLNALIFEMATRGMIFADFKVAIEGNRLRGVATGEAIYLQLPPVSGARQ